MLYGIEAVAVDKSLPGVNRKGMVCRIPVSVASAL